MNSCYGPRLSRIALALLAAAVLTIGTVPGHAQKHQGSSRGDRGSSHATESHTDGGTDHAESGGKKGVNGTRKGSGRSVGGSGSLQDIFRSMEADTDKGHSATSDNGKAGTSKKGARSTSTKGKSAVSKRKPTSKSKAATTKGKSGVAAKGGTTKLNAAADTRGKRGTSGKGASAKGRDTAKEVDEDSDRPAWAGVPGRDGKPGRGSATPGTKRGDIFGDMVLILRDANGVPILKQLPDGTWVVQPVDANGVPLAMNDEGELVDPDAAIEVELSRLNVGRSSTAVLDARYLEAIKNINLADSISLDASGRLVLTTAGVSKAIDSPLENLAIYKTLMTTGTLTGITDPSKLSSLSFLVDGVKTVEDLKAAASFLAAAADKYDSVSVDTVVYMNTILAIPGTLKDSTGSGSYVDFTTFNYDRYATYGTTSVDVLRLQPDGVTYKVETINVYDVVFSGTNYTSTDGGVDGFAQATDDARAVIEYVHDHAIPATN